MVNLQLNNKLVKSICGHVQNNPDLLVHILENRIVHVSQKYNVGDNLQCKRNSNHSEDVDTQNIVSLLLLNLV